MAEMKRTTPPKKAANPAHPSLAVKPQAKGPAPTPEALAAMGGGELAYMRAFRAAEIRHLFPQTENVHPSVQLYGLFAADGSPLMLADSRDLVISGAWQNDLEMATVH
ncbi:MAG: DUF1150 family protein [Rhabdaerophilum sp.]